MADDLSFDLHSLTSALDRSADRILRAGHDLSYRRFRVLLTVRDLGTASQRGLAEALGLSEPSVSRMTGVLVAAGLLDAAPDPDGGHRRRLALTAAGEERVEACRALLETRFAALVARSGVSYADYARDTRRLMAALADVRAADARPMDP